MAGRPADSITGNSIGTWDVTVRMHKPLLHRLHGMVERYCDLEDVWVDEEVDRLVRRNKLDANEALRRAEAAAIILRPGRWLRQDEVVEYLLLMRLVQPDVADLQGELEDPEVENQLRLPGRRLGSNNRKFDAGITVTLPVDMVLRARRAAWRLSPKGVEDKLLQLRVSFESGKITYHRYRTERAKLIGDVVTWSDLVRQAIEWYDAGPQ